MFIEKIQEMTDIIKTMQELKDSVVNKETKTERSRSQYKAIVQIQTYIVNIAEATKDFDWSIKKMPVSLYWLNQNKDKSDTKTQSHCLSIYFHKGIVNFEEPSYSSFLRWDDFCHYPKEKIYKYNSDSEIEGDFIRLINNWDKIKHLIDIGVEKALMDIMSNIQKESQNFVKSYKKATSFQV